ncbi:MAG: V-type ATP synthase subunit E [Planctomycetota bacterium]
MSDEQQQTLEQEIRSDAHKRAERITRRAERQAEQVEEDAREAAEQEREEIMAAARERARHEEQVHEARVRQELARMRREAFQEVLDHVKEEANQRLRSLDREAGRKALLRLGLQAVAAMRGDEFELVLRPEDRERWAEQLAEELEERAQQELDREVEVKVAEDDLDAAGGLTVRGVGTGEVAEQTFEVRMDRLWGDLRVEVADRLNEVGKSP